MRAAVSNLPGESWFAWMELAPAAPTRIGCAV
jgi:hypothetical protein